MTYVLGAPGSGKSTIASLMPGILRSHVILDWDAFMPAASELAKRDVRRSPSTWPS
jgi:adenylate kinase family enzyme